MPKEFYLIKRDEKDTAIIEAEVYPSNYWTSRGWEVVPAQVYYDLDAVWSYEKLQHKAEQFVKRYGREYNTPNEYQTSEEENATSYRYYIDGVADDIVLQIAKLRKSIAEAQAEIEYFEAKLDEACDLIERADYCLEAIDASNAATSEE